MADVEKPDTDKTESDKPAPKAESDASRSDKSRAERSTERRRAAGAKAKATASSARSKLASLLWLIAVVCALFLAVGALLVALKANQDNAVVKFVLDGADMLDLGVFSRDEGVFTFDRDPNGVKSALVNWGLAAMAYLIVGKVLDRIIRP